jgi:hypothetical protein
MIRALINIRNSGVNALASMYEYIEDVKNPKIGG